jgi:hypothetical protein
MFRTTEILNKIVNYYWNSVALDGNPWTWSNTSNRMQTAKFKVQISTAEGLPCMTQCENEAKLRCLLYWLVCIKSEDELRINEFIHK